MEVEGDQEVDQEEDLKEIVITVKDMDIRKKIAGISMEEVRNSMLQEDRTTVGEEEVEVEVEEEKTMEDGKKEEEREPRKDVLMEHARIATNEDTRQKCVGREKTQ